MDDEARSWPIGLRRLAEVIGPAAAVRLADTIGGTERNYIPKEPRLDHPLVSIIGIEKMEALCHVFGGEKLDIPRGVYRDSKKAAIINRPDMSARELALRIKVSQRYVRRVRSMLKDPNQDDLFD